ncbi:MAG TPA: S41 family peptidase, partial [Blastocatellia bacterium]|nr:S41 family peptidase [Blastocatellia bacterium]
MRTTKRKFKKWAGITVIYLLLGTPCLAQLAPSKQQVRRIDQPAVDSEISGRYEGIGKTQSHGDVPIVIEIRSVKGTITGTMHTALGDFALNHGSYTEGKLTLTVESYDDEGSMTASLDDGKLVGEFIGFDEKARLELKRTGPPSPLIRPTLSLSKEAWREDLLYLAKELPRRHKNAFHRVTREQFERAVAEFDTKIHSLQDINIVMEMSRMVAMVGDGHTNLGWHGLFPRAPVRLFWFGKELRVTETVGAYRQALGARVVKIGNATVEEAYRRDQPYISQGESEEFVLDVNAANMTYPAHLHGLGLAPDTTRARYTFADDKGRRFSLDIKALAPGEQVEWLDAAKKKPLYRQKPDEPLWFTYLPDSQTLYFNFSGYPRRRAFAKFSQDLFDFIDRHAIKRVIVDMRQNGGGDFSRGREFIISGFKRRPAVTRRGQMFVIIGRATYSAGMVNVADFRSEVNAILVGEPTGQRPNSYSENRAFSLPNSHLSVSYSTQYYKVQEKDTPGIIPDKRSDS